jgi:hypothetical protein
MQQGSQEAKQASMQACSTAQHSVQVGSNQAGKEAKRQGGKEANK